MRRCFRVFVVFAFALIVFQAVSLGAEKIYRYCNTGEYHTRYRVVSVLDGDTIQVVSDGHLVTVHLLGIDAPELIASSGAAEQCGYEARLYAMKILDGYNTYVGLDTYNDELAGEVWAYVYVFVRDYDRVSRDIFLNEELVRAGMATVIDEKDYVYVKHRDRLLELQDEAKKMERGLWSKDSCRTVSSAGSVYGKNYVTHETAAEQSSRMYHKDSSEYYYDTSYYHHYEQPAQPYYNYNYGYYDRNNYPYYYNYPQYYYNYAPGYYHNYGCRAIDPSKPGLYQCR